MNKKDLVDVIYYKLGTKHTKKDIKTILEASLEGISKGMLIDDRVELRGFGVFVRKYIASRRGINPATGKTEKFPGSHKCRFYQGESLKKQMAVKQ